MGHANFDNMIKIFKSKEVRDLPRFVKLIDTMKVLEIIHTNVCEPTKTG